MPKFVALTLLTVVALLLAGAAFADTGGPDAGGYRFIDNDEDNGPEFTYVDVRGTGTQILSDVDDGLVEGVPLGFAFPFYGTDYESVNISSNGNFRFLTTEVEFANRTIPTDSFQGPAIFPYWDDFTSMFEGFTECGPSAAVFYQTIGSAPDRRFIVQWNMCHFELPNGSDACTIDVQAILFEGTGHILTQYADTTFSCNGDQHIADNGASASVGIQASPAVGLQYSFGNLEEGIFPTRAITPGLAICFYPDPDGVLESGFCGEPVDDDDEVCVLTEDDFDDGTTGIDIDIDNCNDNEIDLDNDNTNNNGNNNGNFNNNANANDNDNDNTNDQDQTNDQGQGNTNDQTNNIDSSPEVNIDFD